MLQRRGYDVEAPDLRGHGDNDADFGTLTHEALAKDIASYVDKLHESAEDVVLVAHSMAALSALLYVEQERVSGVVTLGGAFYPDRLVEAKPERFEPGTELGQNEVGTPQVFSEAQRDDFTSVTPPSNVKAPTTFIHGFNDDLVSMQHSLDLKELSDRVVLLPCSHFFRGHTKDVVQEVERFVG